ncbi:hypothetical protein GCM10027413_20700 [Conyzicola nivalis]
MEDGPKHYQASADRYRAGFGEMSQPRLAHIAGIASCAAATCAAATCAAAHRPGYTRQPGPSRLFSSPKKSPVVCTE